MTKGKKMVFIVLGALVALVVSVFAIGAALPEDHVAARSATFKADAKPLYDAVFDFEQHASWRPEVKKVEKLADKDGHPVWVETNGFGPMKLERLEADTPKKLVVGIADPDLPFGGTWTFEFTANAGGGTRVTITERGKIKPALFRFVSKFIMGYTTNHDAYLKALAKKFGEEVKIEDTKVE